MKIVEAFNSGTAGKVIAKFIRILGKRLGKSLMTSPLSYDNKTSEGMFKSFYTLFPDGKRAIRFNFLLKDSDVLHSIDIFKGPSRVPDVKVYLEGLNVIQILSTVEQAVRGHITDLSYESIQLTEANDLQLFQRWVQETRIDSTFSNAKFSDLSSSFQSWSLQNNIPEVKNSYNKIKSFVKDYLIKNPGVVPQNMAVATVSTTVPKDRPLATTQQVSEYEEIANEMDDHLKKYEMLEYYLRLLATPNAPKPVNGLFVAGKAGVGKTSSLMPILKSLGVNYVVYKGNVAGPRTLYELLWKHTSNDPKDMIIFDDCDTILKNATAVNILKGAMEDSEIREVSYVTRGGMNESRLQEVDGPVSLTDFGDDSAATVTTENIPVPDTFEVGPKIIFISNLPAVPPAIGSRCLRVVFDFTEDQIWDLIASNIDNIIDPTSRQQRWDSLGPVNFRPLTRAAIEEIILFCRKLRAGVDSADFRQINFACVVYCGCNDDSWKRWVRMHFRRI